MKRVLVVAAIVTLATACTSATAPRNAHKTPARPRPTPTPTQKQTQTQIVRISTCPGSNAEVEEASAPPAYLYADWIGCDGIGFAASADGGRHWGPAVTVPVAPVPGSKTNTTWDPAIAVAPDGTVYVSYMYTSGRYNSPAAFTYPTVAVSTDHGKSFAHVYPLTQPHPGTWGDRDFIAAGPVGTLYLTWDYGPVNRSIKLLCDSSGSCAFSNGELNAVMQVSRDGGRTWGPVVPVQPGFPAAGGDSAAVVVNPASQAVDVLYLSHQTDAGTLRLHPGQEYFASSADGIHWPPGERPLAPAAGPVGLREWWIDGAITADTAGNLYATWDTQPAPHTDVGWLSVSTDQGGTWSSPLEVTPDRTDAPHIVQAAGGPPGVAYIAWLTSAPASGYALFTRTYAHGRLGQVRQVSAKFGEKNVWPGDTFGIAAVPRTDNVALTWGSAVPPSKNSQIYAITISAGS